METTTFILLLVAVVFYLWRQRHITLWACDLPWTHDLENRGPLEQTHLFAERARRNLSWTQSQTNATFSFIWLPKCLVGIWLEISQTTKPPAHQEKIQVEWDGLWTNGKKLNPPVKSSHDKCLSQNWRIHFGAISLRTCYEKQKIVVIIQHGNDP